MFDQIFANMKAKGLAYRGRPGDPRVKLQTVISPTAVFLTSCPMASPTDPYTQYYVKTGKAVPPPPQRDPPPPYKLTLTMVHQAGQWKLSDLLQNVGKTCTG